MISKENTEIKEKTQQIRDEYSSISDKCKVHDDFLECFCTTCKEFICYRCILDHKSHEIIEEDELSEIDAKLNQEFLLKLKLIWEKHSEVSKVCIIKQHILKEIEDQKKIAYDEYNAKIASHLSYVQQLQKADNNTALRINKQKLKHIVNIYDEISFFEEYFSAVFRNLMWRSELAKELQQNNSEVLINRHLFEISDLSGELLSVFEPTTDYSYNSLSDFISSEEMRYIHYLKNPSNL
jgi:hypothetical protein